MQQCDTCVFVREGVLCAYHVIPIPLPENHTCSNHYTKEISITLVRECKNCRSFHTENIDKIDIKGICRYSCMLPLRDPTDWCEQFRQKG